MLKSLMRFFKKKEPVVIPPKKYKFVTEKVNVQKCFGTLILKNGEQIITKPIEGRIHYEHTYGYSFAYTKLGKHEFIDWIDKISERSNLVLVNDNRMVRGTDIIEVVGVVVSDHFIDKTNRVEDNDDN